jgi:uncharacterized membrane protein
MCGNSNCETLLQSPYAWVAGVYVGDIGVAGYTLLLIVSCFAVFQSGRVASQSWNSAYLGSFGGLAFSIYLVAGAAFGTGAICGWCLASASVLALTVLLHAVSRIVNCGPSPLFGRARCIGAACVAGLILGGSALVAFWISHAQQAQLPLARAVRALAAPELIPSDAYSIGPATAPLTAVVFEDLLCPGCQEAATKLIETARSSHNLRVVLRNAPLVAHRNSRGLAVFAEACGALEKREQFVAAIDDGQIQDSASAEDWLRSVKIELPPESVERANRKVARDIALAKRLNVRSVPVILLSRRRGPFEIVHEDTVIEATQLEAFR